MNVVSSSSSRVRRFALAVVALSATTFLAVIVSTDASAKNIDTASVAMESEIDSIPGSSANFATGSSLEGPLMASDPTFIVADSLQGPLTATTTDSVDQSCLQGPLTATTTDSVDQSSLQGPLN